jgi:hypothetical protein
MQTKSGQCKNRARGANNRLVAQGATTMAKLCSIALGLVLVMDGWHTLSSPCFPSLNFLRPFRS